MKKNVIILISILFGVILLILISFFTKHFTFNDENIVGNTPGNLNNDGLFCEQNNIVYFSNPYDDDILYSMNADETDLKRLLNVSVHSINADSKRIFYSQSNIAKGNGLGYIRNATGLYSCSLKGKNTKCLVRNPVGIISLAGNYLYYQNYTNKTGTYLNKIRIDKKEEKEILYEMVTPASISNGLIYFNGMDKDHYLYALDTRKDTVQLIWEHNLYNPIFQDGYVYYMDLDSNYELHRYELSTGKEDVLSTDRLDFFNLYGNIIYYQKSSETNPALKRIMIDGTNDEIVKEGVFEHVNITSKYAYFNEFDKPVPVYHQPTFGGIQVSTFDGMILKSKN